MSDQIDPLWADLLSLHPTEEEQYARWDKTPVKTAFSLSLMWFGIIVIVVLAVCL